MKSEEVDHMIARSFRELKTYELARDGAKQVFAMTRTFPGEERYSLTDQVRRSSRAVMALLAEAWARRRYKAAFVNKIDEALGEAVETQAWLDNARDCGYIDADLHARLDVAYQAIGGKLTAMISRANDFCKYAPDHPYAAEQSEPYGLEEL